ncbi:MAG: EamA family transporter [Candidatus Rifleibacteriota bacterium]
MAWLIPALLALVIWGFWGLFPKLACAHISPISALFFQTLGSVIIVAVILLGNKFKVEFHSRGIMFALLGGAAGTLGSVFYNTAAKTGKISVVVALTAMYPIVTIVLSYFWLDEPLTGKTITAIGLAISSIIVLTI